MIALINKLLDWFKALFWKEEMELTLVGLQYSGKTTFVNVIAVSVAGCGGVHCCPAVVRSAGGRRGGVQQVGVPDGSSTSRWICVDSSCLIPLKGKRNDVTETSGGRQSAAGSNSSGFISSGKAENR